MRSRFKGFCDFLAIEGMTKEASELVAWRMRKATRWGNEGVAH